MINEIVLKGIFLLRIFKNNYNTSSVSATIFHAIPIISSVIRQLKTFALTN